MTYSFLSCSCETNQQGFWQYGGNEEALVRDNCGNSGLRLGLARIRSEGQVTKDSDLCESRYTASHDRSHSSLWYRRVGTRLLLAI